MGKVLHASGSGYFTECIQAASSPDHCPWTLERAMDTYWRVRTWKFEVSGLSGESGGDLFPYSSTIDNITSGDRDRGVIYTSEEQLVCFNEFFYDDPDFSGFSLIGFGNPEKSGSLYTSGINGKLLDEPRGNETYEFRVYPEYYIDPDGPAYPVSFSIFGKTIPMIVYEPSGASIEYADVVATLTPTLWWSYGETYDTSTGARL